METIYFETDEVGETNEANEIDETDDLKEIDLLNNISRNIIKIINGVTIEIPSFTSQLNDLNLKCSYNINDILDLSSIINEKQMKDINEINEKINEIKNDYQKESDDNNPEYSIKFQEKYNNYLKTKKKYQQQVIKIIITRRKTFLNLKKMNWIIQYKIKKRKELSLLYEANISKLNSENYNEKINNNDKINNDEKIVSWIYLSYPEYRKLYKPSLLITSRKLKTNFQYLLDIKLRVIQDREELKYQMNILLKLIQNKKKELNHLLDIFKNLEIQEAQLFDKLLLFRKERIKEILSLKINNCENNNVYKSNQSNLKKELLNDLRQKTINFKSISILKYDHPPIIKHLKEIKKFINSKQIEKTKQNIMITKNEMNDTYLKHFNNRLNNNFHISPHIINKIRNTYPLIYKNQEGFQAFKYKILNNQIKTLHKIKNNNQSKIEELNSDLNKNILNINNCFLIKLPLDKDFKNTYQYYQKVIEKKEQHLLKAYRNYKKLI